MVAFSTEALDALEAIRQNPRFSLEHATAMAKKIVAACTALDTSPHGGHKGRVDDTLEIIVKPFVIVFEISGAGAKIISIWHGRQSRQ